jgi:hypothetical protein
VSKVEEAFELKAKKLKFCSMIDEELFFTWLDKIPSIVHVEGIGDCIHIFVEKKITKNDLREILAVFYRYNIEMTQLQVFNCKAFSKWFPVPGAYWYERVFL